MEGENGIITKIKDKSIIVDHTTASAEIAENIQKNLKPKNIGFLDAPISGGQAGAENAALSIMIGGEVNTMKLLNQF